MGTYTGLHYGLFLDAEKLTSEEEVEKYFNHNETSILRIIQKETNFETNSLDNINAIFLSQLVYGYNYHFSGGIEKFEINEIIEFNNILNTINKEIKANILKMNTILTANGFSEIDENVDFYYFEHTIS